MSNAPQIAEVAALVGDPARASILCALLGGRALTATELAHAAGVSPQTTSGHLGKLHAARLLVLMKQGRHRYYRLAGPQVGADAGRHHDCRAERAAALSAEVQARRRDAARPHLLRSFRRHARRRPRRSHGRARAGRARRRGRRGDARRACSSSAARRRPHGRPPSAASSAAPASIGPSAARISAARSAPRSRSAASSSNGSSASATAARCASRLRAAAA